MTITAEMVKELRQKTGAGMMDCKKALVEKDGNLEAAAQFLREKGIADAAKRSARATSEGAVGCYIHTGAKLGVLVEVNCETDFVARTDDFKDLIKNISMQICSESPICISREEVPAEVLEREKQIAETQARQTGKPEKVIEKIVAGKLDSFYARACLLEQEYIRDRNLTVQEYIKSVIAKLGENIMVRRFTRYQLGEE
jgi:elongation factor Ts